MNKNDTGKGYTYPDVQYMDMNYDRYYLVPWPDFQKFEELDPDYIHVIPAIDAGEQVCFVNAEWIGDNYE